MSDGQSPWQHFKYNVAIVNSLVICSDLASATLRRKVALFLVACSMCNALENWRELAFNVARQIWQFNTTAILLQSFTLSTRQVMIAFKIRNKNWIDSHSITTKGEESALIGAFLF